ncbi:MAG: P-loop NTPase [Candidatus Cardinium sp.]|nr:P-loop NTPase [Candidatus Cardinium sp.]
MKIITVASTKGGVGKSTFILNLATTLLKLGHKVAALDTDM